MYCIHVINTSLNVYIFLSLSLSLSIYIYTHTHTHATFSRGYLVSVRLDKREVHRTSRQRAKGACPNFQETNDSNTTNNGILIVTYKHYIKQ